MGLNSTRQCPVTDAIISDYLKETGGSQEVKDLVEIQKLLKNASKILFLARVMIILNHDLPLITVHAKLRTENSC